MKLFILGCISAVLSCFLHGTWAVSPIKKCEKHSDCPVDSFCDSTILICETCVPCERLFNRKSIPTDSTLCAKSEEECGSCLPGYQAEDQTVQRRSFKCYPSLTGNELNSEGSMFARSGIPWSSGVAASAALVVFVATLLTAFTRYFLKRHLPRCSNNCERLTKVGRDDSLPPPYDQVGPARMSNGYTIITLDEQDSLNEATPFSFHQHFTEESDHPSITHPEGEELSSSSLAGSTETIPSLWEPSRDGGNSPHLQQNTRHYHLPLRRSYSLNSLVLIQPNAELTTSRSVCDLTDGIYRHRHIQLSAFRRNPLPSNDSGIKIDPYEPLPPQSFLFQDTDDRTNHLLNSFTNHNGNTLQVQQGSQDSGFFQDVPSTSSSRRRPASNDQVQFFLTVYSKRRRQN